MDFTPSELRLAARLKERERAWRWVRWAALLFGLLVTAIGLIFFRELWKELEQEELLLMLIAVVGPGCCIFVFAGSIAVGYALVFWKGRPERKLLLRLIDEAEARRTIAVSQCPIISA